MTMNSLAVLAAASLAGADLALAALSLSQIEPAAGRASGARWNRGGEASLIDESYNANPASMVAALGRTRPSRDRAARRAHRSPRRYA